MTTTVMMMILTRLKADPPPSTERAPKPPERSAFYRRKTVTVNALRQPSPGRRITARRLNCTPPARPKFAARRARPASFSGAFDRPAGRVFKITQILLAAERFTGLRFSGRNGSPDAARVRRAAFVLLLLTLHAVQAGATHLPRRGRTATLTAHALSSVGSFEATASTAPAESGAHAQCLLCRLQRNLATGLKNSAPAAFSPPQDSLLIASASTDNPRTTPPAATPGRAPPRS